MTKRILTNARPMLIVLNIPALLFAGGCVWQHDVTVKGIAFSKVKMKIGVLKEEAIIGGRLCGVASYLLCFTLPSALIFHAET